MKNFHLPLPEETYRKLRSQAELSQMPATVLAREAIDEWLKGQARAARGAAIKSYAEEMAGSSFDLDPALDLS